MSRGFVSSQGCRGSLALLGGAHGELMHSLWVPGQREEHFILHLDKQSRFPCTYGYNR